MLLSAYEAATQQLIQALTSSVPLIDTPTLDGYINDARNQVAGEGECVVAYPATLAITAPTQIYNFSSIVLPPAAVLAGFGPVINVRQAAYLVANAQKQVYPRAWPWLKMYYLDQPVPDSGAPHVWAQFAQGVAGSLAINLPDIPYTLNLDVVCLPIPLVNGASPATPDAIPALWDDAVPFYAAWRGMQNAQRQADADMMMARYKEMMARARSAATPSQMPGIYSQGPDPAMQNRYGIAPARSQQGSG